MAFAPAATQAQKKFVRMLILVPEVVTTDARAAAEAAKLDSLSKGGLRRLSNPGDQVAPEVQLMETNRTVLAAQGSMGVMVAATIQELFLYFLYDAQAIIILVDEHKRSGRSGNLAAIARSDSMDYVLALSELRLAHRSAGWQMEMNVTLYEAFSDSVIAARNVLGTSDVNNGSMYACERGTLACALTNSVKATWEVFSGALHDGRMRVRRR